MFVTHSLPSSIDGVAYVEVLRGAEAPPDAAPDLLVEVPHGADERKHYDALRSRLRGDLPEDLHLFFHMNTDEGAWAYGRATAEAVVAADPRRSALLIRCLIPRTFIDCNRPADYAGSGEVGGLTAGIPSYVRDEGDRALLLDLHQQYVELVRGAYAAVCGAGGLALLPHTYGPRTLDIASVGDDIVEQLRWAYAPERAETWPLRPEVDLLTRDGEGKQHGPPEAEGALLAAFEAAGLQVVANQTYYLHPGALGFQWSVAYPEQVLSLEVRRDVLVEGWDPFSEGHASPARVERIAAVLAPTLARVALRRQP